MICTRCKQETGNNNPTCGELKDQKSCTYRVYMNEYKKNWKRGILKTKTPTIKSEYNLKNGEAAKKARKRAQLIRLGYCVRGDDSWLNG